MGSKIRQTQTQVQRLNPQQILQANIMQLTNALLEQRIIKELEDNPTLEIVDEESEESEEEEEESDDDSKDESDDSEFDWEELDSDSDRFELNKSGAESSNFLVTNHTLPKTLSDRIRDQLIDINISDKHMNIAHEIIGDIDDDGYFKVEPILIADRTGASESEVLNVLKIIQSLEPRGIASKNLQECMSLQIDSQQHPLAHEVVSRCFDDFTAKRYEKICSKLKCSMDALGDAVETIKKINPKPGDGLPAGKNEFIIPDIIIEKRGDDWVIHMNDQSMYELRVSDEYSKMLDNKKLDKSARRFIKNKTESANWFIDAINQRKQTMLEIMNVIVKRQSVMFKEEKQELAPMILKDVATELDIDISTVSRATNGKYVQLPWGIFEIKDFFSESIMTISGKEVSNTIIKNRVKEMIDGEKKSKPHDDQAIVDMLIDEGYIIARRTISKYRNLMGIPKAKLRREIGDE